MTYGEKKVLLENYLTLDAEIDALINEKQKWYKRALKLKEDSQSVFALNKVISLEKEIDRKIDNLVDLRGAIYNSIEKLDDFMLKKILYLKYISGKTFEEIGEEVGYCTRQISRLHKKAIDMLNIT